MTSPFSNMFALNYLKLGYTECMDSYLDEIRFNIKHYRQLQKITQADLAERCDCSTGTIGGIESGRAKPSLPMMITIAEALHVHPADLFIQDASKSQGEIKQEVYARVMSIFDNANEQLKAFGKT